MEAFRILKGWEVESSKCSLVPRFSEVMRAEGLVLESESVSTIYFRNLSLTDVIEMQAPSLRTGTEE